MKATALIVMLMATALVVSAASSQAGGDCRFLRALPARPHRSLRRRAAVCRQSLCEHLHCVQNDAADEIDQHLGEALELAGDEPASGTGHDHED